ncbi:uncharacterized protein MAM_00632 [Metarhizium album ARSEF 1941]|uniref:Endo-beta-1,2-glucanase SGL domain-containing protein n=1 Tax=Metarhizium album (strain ARSEF 1941) TaxID=1081103 RepID=A0A0B2X8J9_METAS|nr:uncharacterized protein MAM_00632 [Metarhizium album ARSEF 1941]KHO01631.1 hypothetical protein MAM_00632 [Metarhizium album ARSEF 1941]
MLYAHAISGSKEAARFLAPQNLSKAPKLAASILKTKLRTYLQFNESRPGFGGFLPWMTTGELQLSAAWDWVNRVPALDNGELIWAVYACISALEQSGDQSPENISKGWQEWLDYFKTTAASVLYRGDGHVRAVASINDQFLPLTDPKQGYQCEGTNYLDDPYEGELFTRFLNAFGGLHQRDRDALWQAKRAKLRSVEYRVGGVGPITVEQGYWFSSHELWKVLELPYYDVDLAKQEALSQRRESKNLQLSGDQGAWPLRICQQLYGPQDGRDHVPGPPSRLTRLFVGLAWWRSMVTAKKMQNPYGSTESSRVDGELVSALVTWDSKITTVVALLGGVGDLVRPKMKKDGIYDDFIFITKREYSRVFKDLKGEGIALCLPNEVVPDAGLKDFTLCSA